MKTLVIPDVHEDMAKVKRALAMFPDLPRVWLGDFFDSFYSTSESVEETCDLLNTILDSEDDLIIGNHCNHYMFDHRYMICSGFDRDKRIHIRSKVDMAKWRKRAKLFHVREGYVLAHAGFHPSLLPKLSREEVLPWLEKRCKDGVDLATAGQYPTMFHAGFARGGTHPVGGPNWMDWMDFEEIPALPQLVGHTKGRAIRQKGESYCIDTALRHVAILEDGNVEIVEVKDASE